MLVNVWRVRTHPPRKSAPDFLKCIVIFAVSIILIEQERCSNRLLGTECGNGGFLVEFSERHTAYPAQEASVSLQNFKST